MAKEIRSDFDFLNVSRILNLPNATLPQEPATFAQLSSAIEGTKFKEAVRVASFSNLNLSALGATIDGVTFAVGERFLAGGQTVTSENGVYVYQGAAVAATRATDSNSATELNGNPLYPVIEGTSEGVTFRQSAVVATVGTDPITFVVFGTSIPPASETVSGRIEIATQAETDAGTDDLTAITPLKLKTSPFSKKKFVQVFGDGTATQYAITHNLNDLDIVVEVFRNSGAGDTISCDVSRTDSNTVTLNFSAAPTTNQFKVVILG